MIKKEITILAEDILRKTVELKKHPGVASIHDVWLLVVEIEQDALAIRNFNRAQTVACEYCGKQTTNFFAKCCDKTECRAKRMQLQNVRKR